MRAYARTLLSLVLAISATACSDASGTTTTLEEDTSTTQPAVTATTGDQGANVTTTLGSSVATSSSSGGVPEIDLVPASDLPEGIPVPVPAGGTEGSLSVFGYDSYSAIYPGSMSDSIAAFYDAWFTAEGLAVEPEFGGGEERRWRVTSLDIDVSVSPGDGELTLLISWPEG